MEIDCVCAVDVCMYASGIMKEKKKAKYIQRMNKVEDVKIFLVFSILTIYKIIFTHFKYALNFKINTHQ